MCTHGMVPWYRENPFLWKIDNLILWKMWKDFGNALIRWSRSLKKISVSHPIIFYVAMIWRKNTMFLRGETKKSSMCGFLLLLATNEFGIIVTKNNSG